MNLSLVKPALLLLLLLWQTVPRGAGHPEYFRYRRAINFSNKSSATQACAILDASVFAHSAPSLKDLRVYSSGLEVPYAMTLSEPLQQESEYARLLNLSFKSGHIVFDLDMPRRPYTNVSLELAAQDYVAKVIVSGSASAGGKDATRLGAFTLFDLTSQRLSHSTDIPLPESVFPYLHLELTFKPAPGSKTTHASQNIAAIVKGATVPPSREAQSLYTTTQTAMLLQKGQESVAKLDVESRVPIERIAFTLPSGYKESFSRAVRITAHSVTNDSSQSKRETAANAASSTFGVETVTGSILRVHRFEGGNELSAENLSVPVAIGSNMQQPALVEVAVENGTDSPLPLTLELQMRQRRICFDTAKATAPLALYYGNPSLESPTYVDAVLTHAAANPRIAELAAEANNPGFAAPRPLDRRATYRPILRWIALLGCVCISALLVLRRSDRWRQP